MSKPNARYDQFMSPSEARMILDQASRDRDWAPPGGTSNNRYHEERAPFDTEFVRLFCERIEAHDDDVWIKIYNESQIYVGWRDDPRGSYYVAWGLEHQYRLAPEELRSFSYLVYHLTEEVQGEDEGEIIRTDEGIGAHYQEPPYARDAALHVDHLMIWVDAHRRTLDHLTGGAS